MHADHHCLDGNLEWTHVHFFHHLIDLCEHGFVVADHHHVVAGELVASRVGIVGGDAPTSDGVRPIAPTFSDISGVISVFNSAAVM